MFRNQLVLNLPSLEGKDSELISTVESWMFLSGSLSSVHTLGTVFYINFQKTMDGLIKLFKIIELFLD